MTTQTFRLLDPGLAAQAERRGWEDPAHWESLTALTADHPAPLAVLSAPALLHNALQLRERVRRAAAALHSAAPGVPAGTADAAGPHDIADAGPARRTTPTIRLGSKSIRCRAVLEQLLELDGYAGVFGFTLPEALFLHEHGFGDIVVGYPTVDRAALAELCERDGAPRAITLMIDDEAQLDLIDAVRPPGKRPTLQLCLDLDLSLDLPGPLPRIGVWRSPLHRPDQVLDLAERILRRPGFEIAGLLGYEAQLAGVPDDPRSRARGVVVRRLQTISRRDVAARRAETVERLRQIADLRFVNGGGSGSVESTAADPSVTEIAAGSALTGPHLFDSYRAFTPAPATAFALDVVRCPSPGRATVLGGGWTASGPAGEDRLPRVCWPPAARYEPLEGAGEVQTPLRAGGLRVGDRVWFRHAKGGELAEHVGEYLVVTEHRVLDRIPTYRGEGKAFL